MTAPYGAEAAERAAAAVRARVGAFTPAAAIVLGSGLGGLAARIRESLVIKYSEIPGFPPSTVAGHAGELLAGTLAGRRVLALAGRFHMYEGHDAALAAFPARVLHALGARVLIVSNAAGGINPRFAAGTLMLIDDHVNLMFRNPLVGRVESGDERFPDMSAPYDPDLRALARAVADANGIALAQGVYAGLLGPSYETRAEVRMLAALGIDAVGMSTVPEVIVARAIGMRVLGVSCITNPAAGLSDTPITHAEVIETTARAAERFEALVTGVVAAL
ncbi:MAG TPA: purine-nucleoside phosphorylase [Gemmatimonadaceae bacterium]|nr:purine-nucleoside phosphorylase [Gemmatimonadaceae bacterium]